MAQQALVLSGPIGLGHEMMARACGQVLGEQGWQVSTHDSMEFAGTLAGRVSARVARRLMSTGGFYDALHFAHLRTGSRLARGMARLANDQLVPALRAELDRVPADLVLSVFATGASAAAALASDDPARRTVVLCTDACVHRLWVWEGTDLFLVTSPAAEMSVRRFLPSARVRVVPAPVRSAFFAAPPRAQARDLLGLSAAEPCALLMDSGWGFGPLAEAARALAGAGVQVLAVAGRNSQLLSRLRAPGPHRKRIHGFGLTDQVPLLMAAADLVVTLPGATTCGEARAMGRPLMLLDLMPGHGRDNLQHQLDLGDAYVCDATAAGVTAGVLAAFARGLPTRERSGANAWPDAFTTALASIGLAAVRPPAGSEPDIDGEPDVDKERTSA